MLTSYYTLHLLARTMDTVLRRKRIAGAYTHVRNQLVVAFADGGQALVVECQPRTATLYLQPRHARPRRNVTDVLPRLSGERITAVTPDPADRVVTLRLSAGLRIVVLCYGSSPNVLVSDGEDLVVDAFLDAKRLGGTRLPVPAGAEEEIPDLGAVDRAIDGAPGDLLALVLRRAFPRHGELLTREILHRAGIDPFARSGDAAQRARLQVAIAELHRDLADPRPRVYLRGAHQEPVVLSLVPLGHLADLPSLPFDDVHEAVRVFLSRRHAEGRRAEQREQILGVLERFTEKTRRTLDALAADLERADRAAGYEHYGRLLLAHPDVGSRGAQTVTLEDESGPVVIPLDPRLTPVQNAQKYFTRARSARTARREVAERRAELQRRLNAAGALGAAVAAAESPEALRGVLEAHREVCVACGIRTSGSPAATLSPFRVFTVDGGFQVWAGKNSTNNDELTLRHARPDDLWFHVRGGGGAHVVLKTGSGRGEPGRKAREQAAGIAAWYSSMKHASMVPVVCTLRKYVRKPKGAPPGTVAVARETVMFAEPGLPEQERHRTSGGTA